MRADDLICYCFRVSQRKLVNFARRERPARASQMSECLGAGSGCGWCIPFLKRIQADPDGFDAGEIDSEQYEAQRAAYRAKPEQKNTF